ncbi:MAG: DUF6531 domain-containing protein [Anaerolineales bacterium]
MKWVMRSGALLFVLLLGLPTPAFTRAQDGTSERTLSFGETVSGFLTPEETAHTWQFSANGLEIVEVILERISGQLTPRVSVQDATGAVISPDESLTTASGQILRFVNTFGAGGTYTLQVTGENIQGSAINPDEYSLQLLQNGVRLPDVQAGLSVPNATLAYSPPTLESGAPLDDQTGDARLIDVAFYGNPTVVRPDPGRGPQDYQVSAAGFTIETLWNGSGAQRVTRSVSFTPQGIGIVAQPRETDPPEAAPPFFFTDQNITRIENTATTITIILEDGTTITTDYFKLRNILAVEGLVVANAENGAQMVLDGPNVTLTEENDNLRMGLSPPNTPEDDALYIISDLQGWQILTYLPDQEWALQILSGANFRFLSNFVRVTITQRLPEEAPTLEQELTPAEAGERAVDATPPTPNPAPVFEVQLDDDDDPAQITLDTAGLGDVQIANGALSFLPLDGRTLTEDLATISAVLVQNRVVRFAFVEDQPNAFRLSFPDGTEVITPVPPEPNPEALPHQPGYTPAGFNNLGLDYLPVCPCLETRQQNTPVNPVNGNFYYHVQDYQVPSHTLRLDFTRHYNSLGGQTTPAYMRESPTPYLLGQWGPGWRHSHHIEIDITFAPLGRVMLIQPDGTRHIFEQSPADPSLFLSDTLPMWRLSQPDGALGGWQALRTDGLRYIFDAVGRLQRLRDIHGDELTFAPAPREYLLDGDSGGYFVVEPYGRRLEIYWDASGRITRLRTVDDFEVAYGYDADGNLSTVQYADTEQSATYAYMNGRLTDLNDDLSPGGIPIQVEYDLDSGRVVSLTENPAGSAVRTRSYTYEERNPGRATIESLLVNGVEQQTRWLIDTAQRVERVELPREGWSLGYEYSLERPTLLANVRQPEGARLAFVFNDQGLLTRLTDPIYSAAPTQITYQFVEDDPHQQLVSEITYRSGGYDRFTYDEQNRLIRHAQLVAARTVANEAVERVTRFTYDERNRIAAIIQPGPEGAELETSYTYDAFGYVSRIEQDGGIRTLEFVHDRAGRLSSLTDGRGNATALRWEVARNVLVGIDAPLDYSRRFVYDIQNRLIRWEDGTAITEFVYDGLGRVISLTDPDGQTISYTYDEADNLLTELRGDGETRFSYTYDTLNNLASVTSPGGLVTTYAIELERGADSNPTGRLQRIITDPNGRDEVYVYDPLGRLTEVRFRDVNDRNIRTYNFVYTQDRSNLQINRSDFPGRNLTLTYDLLGRPTSSSINTAQTTYAYDLAGNLIEVIDPSERTTRYAYDALGNVTSVTLPGDVTYTYSYDENGNLLAMTDPTGALTEYVYDALNRLQSITDPLGRRTSYSYDANGNLLSLTDPRDNTRRATYDTSGRLLSLTDEDGQTTNYTYDVLGRLAEINAPGGLFSRFTYDANDNIVSLNQPQSRNTLYGYDALGRVISVTDALGHTSIFTYDRLDRLSRAIDPVGNIQEYDWNSNGRLLRLNDPLERVFEYNLDGLGRLARVRDRNDEVIAIDTLFNYDPAGYVVNVRTGNGQVIGNQNDVNQVYTYTPQGWLQEYTDPNNNVWRLEYDDVGRVIAQIDPTEQRTVYTRDAAGQVTQITHAAGSDTEVSEFFAYDDNGNSVAYTAPGGLESRFEYDANDRLTQRTVGVNTAQPRAYRYTYNALGYLVGAIGPDGQVTEYQYDVFGNLVGILRTLESDEDDVLVLDRFAYDAVGNLVAVVQPEGFEGRDPESRGNLGEDFRANLTYNALDHRVRYVDAEDNVWAYTYDRLGNVLEISDPLGSVVRYRYDTVGRVSSIEYPTGALVEFRYDRRDNLNAVQGAETEVRTFGARETVNAQRVLITYDIDAEGNLIGYEDSDGDRTTFEYDVRGQRTARVAANGDRTTYEYDALGRLTATSSPDGRITRSYNADGRLIGVDAPGSSFDFTYNDFGELVTAFGQGLQINYERDLNGNVLVRDAGDLGRAEYTYDALGRMIRVDYQRGDTASFIEFSYNRNDWLMEIRRSNGVATVYNYDTNGRPLRVTHNGPAGLLDFFVYTYDSVGNITRISRADGWSVLYSYDTSHQVINERWLDPNSQTRYFVNVRYDQAGNRAETLVQTREQTTPTRTLYVYDRENQLVEIIVNYVPPDEEAAIPNAAAALGLVLGMVVVWRLRRRRRILVLGVGLLALSLVVPMAAWAFQLGDVDWGPGEQRFALAYDDNGNLTQIVAPNGNTINYSYDSENRLRAATGVRPDGQAVDTALTYDPFSRLQEWQTLDADGRAVTFRYFYDGEELIGIQNRNTGERISFLASLPGMSLLTQAPDGATEWHLHDALNSVRRLVGADGTVNVPEELVLDNLPSYDFNAFGEQIRPYGDASAYAPPSYPVQLFAGELYDATTQHYIMGVRHYAPQLGRFFQRDPIRHDPQGNLYTYAYNRPGYFVDPQGTTPEIALQATRAYDLPDQLLPDMAVGSILDDIPTPPPVHALQYAENMRALEVATTLSYRLNEDNAVLDPALADFYIYRVNPMPDVIQQQRGAASFAMQTSFTSGEGWRQLPTPSPDNPPAPLRVLHQSDPWLRRSWVDPLAWCMPSSPTYLTLPQNPTPDAISSQWARERAFLPILRETPLAAGIMPTVETLNATVPSLAEMPPRVPSTSAPEALINPVSLERLDALRNQQTEFYREALLPAGVPGAPD